MAGEILKQVKERFPSHAILEHLQIFDPRNLPTVLAGYGEQQISGLMAYFGKPHQPSGSSRHPFIGPTGVLCTNGTMGGMRVHSRALPI
jgi:hypothetical protein